MGSARTEPQDSWRQPVSHPLLFFAVSPLSLLPAPFYPFSLLLPSPSPSLIPHSPRLSTSVARAPFPCTSASAGSRLCIASAAASISESPDSVVFRLPQLRPTGGPLAALPAALRPSLSPLDAGHP